MNAIDPNAGTGTHDALIAAAERERAADLGTSRPVVDPVHAGPLKSWRETEARVRADEPAPFRPGNPVFMAGWRSCQEQSAGVAIATVAECGGGSAFADGWRAACEYISRELAAMRPEAPR